MSHLNACVLCVCVSVFGFICVSIFRTHNRARTVSLRAFSWFLSVVGKDRVGV